jgi:hypothetical protein
MEYDVRKTPTPALPCWRGRETETETETETLMRQRARAGKGACSRQRLTFAALAAALLLAGCHGSTLDVVYPGDLGHTPPPAVNLPPQDAGLERM